MTILVTGGAGFMGSNFIRYILKKYPEYKVINLDKLTYAGNIDNLKDVKGLRNYRFVKGDICDQGLVDKLVKEAGMIINYAAETHVDRSILDARDFAQTNIIGTLTLLQSARKQNIIKYIQISTDEVFGSIEKGSFTEESLFAPNSPYAAAKAGGDLLCRSFFMTYKLPVMLTHSVNFFGPYQFPEKLIPLFITNLLEHKKVPLYGDGKQVREWIFTEDHCSAVDIILHRGKPGEVYNIGAGYEKSNIEVTKMILKMLGKSEKFIDFVKDRPGHDRRYSLDTSKIERELGWKPLYSFEEALNMTVDWYKKNPDWWRPLKEINKQYFEHHYSQK